MTKQNYFPLNREVYEQKVLGGWLGKAIGGTLGAPDEGKKEILDLSFYDPVPEGSVPNDDLDLQLVWLHVMQSKGLDLDVNDLAQAWLDHIKYPFDEYGVAISNLKKGLRPPASGYYNNFFHDGMGASIRSEIWAFINPGQPLAAMEYAYRDAVVDHALDGVYGEVFLAVVESMAFVESRADVLIEYGLAAIPENSRVAKAVRDTTRWYRQGLSWQEIRDRILLHHGNSNFTDCPQNIAFIILGWLWGGGDFGKSITAAVNCGYDTDCTGATLGAILGIIGGEEAIPEKWRAPIGSEVVVGSGVVGIEAPRTLAELSALTCDFGEKAFTEAPKKCSLDDLRSRALELAEKYGQTRGFYKNKGQSYIVDYHDLPVCTTAEKTIKVSKVEAKAGSTVSINVPFIMPVCWKLVTDGRGKWQEQRAWITEDGNLKLSQISPEADFISLETYVYFAEPTKGNLLVDVNGEVEVKVNGKQVLSYHNHEPLMPAPHRCSPQDIAALDWQKGWNKLTILIQRCGSDCATEGRFHLADLDFHLDVGAVFPSSPQELAQSALQFGGGKFEK